MNRRANHLLQFGSFTFDMAEQRLLREGRAVALKPKIFRLLVTMVENRGQLLEKNDLIVVRKSVGSNPVWVRIPPSAP